MRLKPSLGFALILLASSSFTQASITGHSFQPTDPAKLDGAWTWTPQKGSTDPIMALSGTQYQAVGLGGTIDTDTIADPTLTRGNDVVNDSGFAWGGYKVVITMAFPFTISPATVTSPVSGWTAAAPVGPTLVGGSYVGEIDFSGTPIPSDSISDLNFNYNVSFSGATHYVITEEFTPLPVPEPGTVGIAVLGGMLFGGFGLSRRSRKGRSL